MAYVIAAYAVVLMPLIGYAVHLRGRRRALRQELEASDE
jgi:CcmD family protein